jgi:hypothetical protein
VGRVAVLGSLGGEGALNGVASLSAADAAEPEAWAEPGTAVDRSFPALLAPSVRQR